MASDIVGTIVLFVMFSLVLSILCYELKRFLNIPVANSLLVLGFVFREVGPYLGMLSDVVDMIVGMDPEVIFFSFLPMLIFEASFAIDWYTVKKEIWQIISLATTLVVACSALTALSLLYIFQYELKFNDAFLIGVILSATDHIAVDALLKEIYAADTFETLIGGETMFNDASVFVLFEVLTNGYSGLSGMQESIVLFLRLSFGGFAMGIAFALCMSFILRRALNDFYIATNIMLVTAYLLFWICEYESIHFSGALSLVSYGLFMSAYGKTLISPILEEQIKDLFEIFSRNSESLVFIIAGILLADVTLNNNSALRQEDIWVLFALFPLTYVIRFVVLFVHYPFLKYFGYGLTWKELVILSLSGLKGVISVVLALLASRDPNMEPSTIAIIKYFGIGMAGLSILIGGPVTKIFVRLLGLEQLTIVQENMLVGVTGALVEIIEAKIEDMRKEGDTNLVNWDKVKSSIGTDKLIRKIIRGTKSGKPVLKYNKTQDASTLLAAYKRKATIKNEDMVYETRRRYLATVKALYWENFEEGLCHGETALMLMDSASMSIDREHEKMNDWEYAQKLVYNESTISFYKRMSKWYLVGGIFRKQLYKAILHAYDSANNFIKCHEESEKLIDEMEIDVDEEIFTRVMKEAHKQIKACEKFINLYIIDCYPEVLAEVQTKRSGKVLLYTQRKLITEIYEDGVIKELEYESLIEAIDSSIKALTFKGIPSIPILKEILSYRFTTATDVEISQLISKIKEFEFKPGHIFFTEGHEASGAFFIIRGRVNEKSSWIDQELIIGNIVGVQHLLEEFSLKYTSTATAITSGVAAHIPREILQIEGFVQDMYAEASEELILLNRKRYDLFDIDEKYILTVISKSTVRSFISGNIVLIENGALVMKGKVFEGDQRWIVKPKNKKRVLATSCILLMLPKEFYLSFDKDKSLGFAFEKFCGNSEKWKKNIEVEDLNKEEESRVEESTFIFSAELGVHKPKLGFYSD